MIILDYPSKKELKTRIGERLSYEETSLFGNEVPSDGTCTIVGCNRPHLTGHKREFFAKVTIKNHLISAVS